MPPAFGHPPPAAAPRPAPAGAYRQYDGGAAHDGDQVVIDVGRTNARHLVVGALIGAVLGFPAVLSAVTGLAGGRAGDATIGLVAALLIGLGLSAMPVVTIARAKVLFRKRHLVFSPAGLRWEDPRGTPWFLPWPELESVLVHGRVAGSGNAREPLVFLRLYPADPAHAARHPEVAHLLDPLSDRNVYQVRLSFSKDYIPRLDAAMKRFAPDVYSGVALSAGTRVVPLGNRWPGVLEAGQS